MPSFALHPLLPALKAKVTALHQQGESALTVTLCLCAVQPLTRLISIGDRLYLGYANGTVQVYSYEPQADGGPPDVKLLSSSNLSKRAVDQIGVLANTQQLVILSGTCAPSELSLFSPDDRMEPSL